MKTNIFHCASLNTMIFMEQAEIQMETYPTAGKNPFTKRSSLVRRQLPTLKCVYRGIGITCQVERPWIAGMWWVWKVFELFRRDTWPFLDNCHLWILQGICRKLCYPERGVLDIVLLGCQPSMFDQPSIKVWLYIAHCNWLEA